MFWLQHLLSASIHKILNLSEPYIFIIYRNRTITPTPPRSFLFVVTNQNGKITPGKLGDAVDCGDHHLL